MPLDALIKFRCEQSLTDRLARIAAKERRELPDLLRIALEDYAAAQEQRMAEPAPAYRVNSAGDPSARHRAEVESLEHDMIADNLRKLGPPAKRPPRKPKGAK